jgi:hypothetical protein
VQAGVGDTGAVGVGVGDTGGVGGPTVGVGVGVGVTVTGGGVGDGAGMCAPSGEWMLPPFGTQSVGSRSVPITLSTRNEESPMIAGGMTAVSELAPKLTATMLPPPPTTLAVPPA